MISAKILLVLLYWIRRQNVFGQPYCCLENVTLYLNSTYMCQNSEPPSISCDTTPFGIPDSIYTIQNDTEGEYLIAEGVIVRRPYFCIGNTLEGSGAIYCPIQESNSKEMLTELEQISSSEKILLYFSVAVKLLDFLSLLLMAFPAAVWLFILPDGETVENFLFHFSISLSSTHAFYFYNFVSSNGILPKFCLIIMYSTFFFVLSTFTWFFLIIYYLWKKYKFDSIPSVVEQHYQIIGYGVPTLLIVSGNIQTFVREIVNDFEIKLGCSTFEQVLEEFYVHPFVVVITLTNISLWCNLKRHMKTTISITPENELLQLKINELLTLTGRLLIVLGLPWLLLCLCDFTNELTSYRYEFLLDMSSFLDIVTSGDGIFVSMVLVSSHPRLRKYVLQKVLCKRIPLFRKNAPKRRQGFSSNPTSGHFQMETSPEEQAY